MTLKRGDIVRIDTNKGIGHVQLGNRPALVVSNDVGNNYSKILIVAPMTGILKKLQLPTHVILNGYGLDYTSVVMCEQLQTINKDEVTKKIGSLNQEDLSKIDTALRVSLNV